MPKPQIMEEIKKYYYKTDLTGLCLEECPINHIDNKLDRRIGSLSCKSKGYQQCQHLLEFNDEEQWIKCSKMPNGTKENIN